MKKKLFTLLVVLLLLLGGAWWYIATQDPLGDVPVPPLPNGAPTDPTTPSDLPLGPGPTDPPVVPPIDPGPATAGYVERRLRLREVRRTCAREPLNTFIEAQHALVASAGDPRDKALALHLLAESLLERIYFRNSAKGLRVGKALYGRVPKPIRRDIDAGLAALTEARALGTALGDGFRVEAGLNVAKITGSLSAMSIQSRVNKMYRRALDADAENARLHVALGCRKLFAPRLLGQNLRKAREHLAYACSRLPKDERPRVFAAMAAYLDDDRQAALAWAVDAVGVNPRNPFAVAVLERLRAGESAPFSRDL